MLPVMAERLLSLALAARHARMGLNIDAEEADRLDLSLDVIERVLAEPELAGWNGFGVVVQAYGPRAAFAIDWLYALAKKLRPHASWCGWSRAPIGTPRSSGRRRSGLPAIPSSPARPTPTSPTSPARRSCLSMTDRIYPQFATHNAHTVAAILSMAADRD